MKIVFSVHRDALIHVIEFLSPYVGPRKEVYLDCPEEEGEIVAPKPYFYDKVTFVLHEGYAFLFVLNEDGVRVEGTCKISCNLEEISFCLPFAFLLQEVQKSFCESLMFAEERFFGFNVFDENNKHLFDIEAFSVTKQPSIHPKVYDTLYPSLVSIEPDIIFQALRDFPKYTKSLLFTYQGYIWFIISDGYCKVVATNGFVVRQEIIKTSVRGNYCFTIPGQYAGLFLNTISKYYVNYNRLTISYNYNYCQIYAFCHNHGHSLEFPLIQEELPDLSIVFEKKTIKHQAILNIGNLRSSFKRIDCVCKKIQHVWMHFFKNHTGLYVITRFQN